MHVYVIRLYQFVKRIVNFIEQKSIHPGITPDGWY